MLGFMENCQTIKKLSLVVCGSGCINFLLKPFFDKLAFSLNVAVSMHLNDPNASEMNKYYPLWVWAHLGYLKTWFGAIMLLFYHSLWHRK